MDYTDSEGVTIAVEFQIWDFLSAGGTVRTGLGLANRFRMLRRG